MEPITKQQSREFGRKARQALTAHERRAASAAICEYAQTLAWQSWHRVCIYLPIETLGEVDPRPLAEWLKAHFPLVEQYVPDPREDAPTVLLLDKFSTIAYGKFGVPYPAGAKKAPRLPQFDAVITPSLAVDETGHRVGYGMGWYDRMLASQPQTVNIGLNFESSVVTGRMIESESHDISLDIIITERGIHIVEK